MKEAFFEICKKAFPIGDRMQYEFCSLYLRSTFFGGPEEGGWWGSDVELVATQAFADPEDAREALEDVRKLAKRATADATMGYNRQCLAETEWLDANGLDSSSLPEASGGCSYFAVVEEEPGHHESRGSRNYE